MPSLVLDALELDEIPSRSGSFQGTDRRPRLLDRFRELVAVLRRSDLFEVLLVDALS